MAPLVQKVTVLTYESLYASFFNISFYMYKIIRLFNENRMTLYEARRHY